MPKKNTSSVKKALQLHLTLVIIIWCIHFLNMLTHYYFNQFGLIPRNIQGLSGIIFSPFLHAHIYHISYNSVPLLILGGLVGMHGLSDYLKTSIAIILIGGLLTWIFGRSSIHIGASGLVFGYFGNLIAQGWYSRKVSDVIVAFVVIFFYGGMIWGVLPTPLPVSWEGHLFSFIAGIFYAKVTHKS